MKKLPVKQELFVHEYAIDRNATQAAIRAGYSKKTAYSQGQRLLKNVEILRRIMEIIEKITDQCDVDSLYVLRQAKKLHERCMQEVSPVMVGVGRDRRQLTDDDENPVFEFNASGAAKGLELIGKHVDVQAFKEQMEIKVDGTLVEKLNAAAARSVVGVAA